MAFLRKDTLILVVAVLCGIFSFFLIFNFLKEAAKPKTSVVVAIKPLEAGKILEKSDLGYSRPYKSLDPKNFFLQLDDAVGLTLIQELAQGKAIKRSNAKKVEIIQEKEVVKKVLKVAPGKTAIIIKGENIADLSEAVSVGQYMNLFAPKKGSETEVQAVLENAKIVEIARDQNNKIDFLTMAVSPQEVRKVLNTKGQEGKLSATVSDQPTFVDEVIRQMEIIRRAEDITLVTFGEEE